MNREDIIRLAREAGIADSWDLNWQDKIIERFAALVASAERERIKQANAPEIERINAHIKEALAQPEQKYRRGNRLICLETEEYCVIHISGTDRQWVKFPDSHIGVYTNEQVAELFELLPKQPAQQEPVAYMSHNKENFVSADDVGNSVPNWTDYYPTPLYTIPPPCPTCEALARTVMMDQTGRGA